MYESFTKLSLPVRAAYLVVALGVWVVTLGGRLHRGRAVVLCYHNVRPDQAERFARQAERAAPRVIALDSLSAKPHSLLTPRIVFTFDDAYANLLATVAPVMRRLGAPWSVYAVSGVMGRTPTWTMPEGHPDRTERTMTEVELRSLASDDLVEIGAHTVTHPDLSSLRSEADIDREVEASRRELQGMTGEEIATIALPHGAFDDRVIRAANRAGYRRILTLEDSLEPRRRDDGLVARFSSSPDIASLEFRLLIDGAYCWLGSVRRLARRARGRA